MTKNHIQMERDEISHHSWNSDQRSDIVVSNSFKSRFSLEFRRYDVAATGHQHSQGRRDPAYVAQRRSVQIHLIDKICGYKIL